MNLKIVRRTDDAKPKSERKVLFEKYISCKSMAKGLSENKKGYERIITARSFCVNMLNAYWDALIKKLEIDWKIKSFFLEIIPVDDTTKTLAADLGHILSEFPIKDTGYLLGSIYTVMLPDDIRSSMGAFYTPPPLVERLLDLAENAGFDFKDGIVIDPACGGGAFLSPVAYRMWMKNSSTSAEQILQRIAMRLCGVEIDPFAAWMSEVLLESTLLPLCIAAKMRMPSIVKNCDALYLEANERYDLVIGNPPYGKIKLNPNLRKHYSRSLYGHANLYGLFIDLALRLAKSEGVIALLTPTSFLGGQYFKALRETIKKESSPIEIDFVADREGVFDDVLQETLLASYKRGIKKRTVLVSRIIPEELENARIESLGKCEILNTGNPWLLPRSKDQIKFLNKLKRMPTRLNNLGYEVSTGQLVWNRCKKQLRTTKEKGSFPLIWAESITQDSFKFSAERRNHLPFFIVYPNQSHLITKKSCILVQRTTAKEQDRRILSAILPEAFLKKYRGVVIENHVNIVYSNTNPLISMQVINELFNSEAVDRAFRCISGSVAVSAYELNSLPLPTLAQLKELEKILRSGASKSRIEFFMNQLYG